MYLITILISTIQFLMIHLRNRINVT